jgi:hypothetical protein
MEQAAQPTLKELLLTDDARFEFPLPPRGQRRRRAVRQPEE